MTIKAWQDLPTETGEFLEKVKNNLGEKNIWGLTDKRNTSENKQVLPLCSQRAAQ